MSQGAMHGNSAHFLALRRRLDMMGYNDFPLGLDTTSLAERSKIIRDLELCKSQIEPLQAENSKLTRENVQLHQQLVFATEETMRMENQRSQSAFELQAENRRLKLLNQKSSEHVKELRNQIDTLTKRLAEATSAPSMMKIPETIECDPRRMRKTPRASRASSQISDGSASGSGGFDPAAFNQELENHRSERDQARKEAESIKLRLADLDGVVKLRDEEIDRLGNELQKETGRDGYLISLRHKCSQQEAEIEKLRAQVRVVNPTAAPRHRRLVLTPPRVTITITDDEVYQPSTPSTSRPPSTLGEPSIEIEEEEIDEMKIQKTPKRSQRFGFINKSTSQDDEDEDEEEEEEDNEPKPRSSKPVPVSNASEKTQNRVRFQMESDQKAINKEYQECLEQSKKFQEEITGLKANFST